MGGSPQLAANRLAKSKIVMGIFIFAPNVFQITDIYLTDNLSFLEKTISLQYLRIIGGSYTSIEGLEKCVNLKTLFLQRCTALTNLKPTIANTVN